ncbi:NlpC/P60 family protein [Streptomyces uncialis]|uniref:C40 family peptidase n=1 Tax=Streptomyces uncialis TaxID=1048205 RepID=UPI0022527C37|nr:NlpC/P60 family protein [Streptomyces uncialis]MCX4664270.1 NlpC/P60 family protein [Streptomyces uncialis]
MAAHRKKPRQRPQRGTALRRALTLALAGAATATTAATTGALDSTAQASPRVSPEQVRDQVDRLYQEAEVATERFNGVKEKTKAAGEAYERLQDEAARRTGKLNDARRALGSYATAEYREGGLDPAVRLALSAEPDEYLADTALAERVGDRQAQAVEEVRRDAAELGRLRGRAADQRAGLVARQDELRRHKRTVTGKLEEARRLLARVTAEERARIMAPAAAPAPAPEPPAGGAEATGTRTGAVLAFARRAVGSPYVWGATGPNAFDCSGLTQAAYRAAGVSLPRTTYGQIDAGRRVGRDELRPGDLVFFYSGISHVGLYVGDGKMIHAPNPSSTVRLDPVDQMPFAGATRVI